LSPDWQATGPGQELVEIWHRKGTSGGWSQPAHIHFDVSQIINKRNAIDTGNVAVPVWERFAHKDMHPRRPEVRSAGRIDIAIRTSSGWTFLTGRKEDVTRVREKLGMYWDDGKPEKELGEHSIVLLMGNERAGQWIKRSPYDNPEALARILDTRMLARRGPSGKAEVQAQGAAVMPASPGEELFQSQCAHCHSLGTDNDLGPGLAGGVQRRDRGWLKRWL
jgi:hypothetical protein